MISSTALIEQQWSYAVSRGRRAVSFNCFISLMCFIISLSWYARYDLSILRAVFCFMVRYGPLNWKSQLFSFPSVFRLIYGPRASRPGHKVTRLIRDIFFAFDEVAPFANLPRWGILEPAQTEWINSMSVNKSKKRSLERRSWSSLERFSSSGANSSPKCDQWLVSPNFFRSWSCNSYQCHVHPGST